MECIIFWNTFMNLLCLHNNLTRKPRKMKILIPLTISALLIVSCKKETTNQATASAELLDKNEINQTLYREIDKQGVYNWEAATNELLWSAAMQSDSIFSIGYQPAGFSSVNERMYEIDIESAEWIEASETLLKLILEEEKKVNPSVTMDDLLPFGYPQGTPSLAVYFSSFTVIEQLRNHNMVRYFEPMGYELPPLNAPPSNNRSSSGCGGSAPDYGLPLTDYSTISPGAKESWHYTTSNVSSAWETTSGNDVTVVIIDTGISDDQENLNENFNSGYSTGRTVEQISTFHTGRWWWRKLDGPHDDCGHGTQMAGFAAAPRNSNGNAVGVAYNADLIGIRAVEDVFISSSNEKDGVKNALIIAGNRSDVKVISMSLGTPFYSGTVADGIYYAYGAGKSIFAAAGTSFTWTAGFGVIFPASMDETIAVTGIKDLSPVTCDVCHDGSAVDFTMIMERSEDGSRHGITNAVYGTEPESVGGSSCATATVAGIAVLVYANNPGITRDEVYERLKESGSNYPVRDADHGWGTIDASEAITD